MIRSQLDMPGKFLSVQTLRIRLDTIRIQKGYGHDVQLNNQQAKGTTNQEHSNDFNRYSTIKRRHDTITRSKNQAERNRWYYFRYCCTIFISIFLNSFVAMARGTHTHTYIYLSRENIHSHDAPKVISSDTRNRTRDVPAGHYSPFGFLGSSIITRTRKWHSPFHTECAKQTNQPLGPIFFWIYPP